MSVVPGPWKKRRGRHDDAKAERWRGDLFGTRDKFRDVLVRARMN